jgi:DNA-binding transcriptional ArsR family regulator
VFRLRVSRADLRQMRFAYSPLAEVAESLHMLRARRIREPHRGWFELVRGSLGRVDMPLLRAVTPPSCETARFMFLGAADANTAIERQLQLVAEYPADHFRQDLGALWGGALPREAERLVSDGAGRLADALWEYWQVAIGPYWARIRALLDADVAYWAARLAAGGIDSLLADLDPSLKVHDSALQVGTQDPVIEQDLSGTGLVLVPCAFAWPYVDFGVSSPWPPHLIYGARGVGKLWQDRVGAAPGSGCVLGELLGRSRAEILISVALPMSTTGLARELGQSPPAVSAHLSVLRRSGLVTSWRAGRRVLYQRTALANSIITRKRARRPPGRTDSDPARGTASGIIGRGCPGLR